MRSFNQTKKGEKAKSKDTTNGDNFGRSQTMAGGRNSDDRVEEEKTAAVSAAREALKNRFKAPSGNKSGNKNSNLLHSNTTLDSQTSGGKEMRNWVGVSDKITKKDLDKIDVSTHKGGEIDLDHQKSIYLGGDDDVLEGFYNSDDEIDFENFKLGNKKGGKKQGGGLFSKLTNAFQNIAGNKVLTEDDVEEVLKNFKNNLMEKNVAAEIAEGLCKNVTQQLVDKRTESFTSVKATVKNALVDSIQKLLTPKKNIDLLKDALNAKLRGEVYSAVFIGVNGVGKSTSLAKVAYYLKTKGNLKVMIAGCDNFRSGAIEQLQTHCMCLDIPLYEKGYKDDPAMIAKEAL